MYTRGIAGELAACCRRGRGGGGDRRFFAASSLYVSRARAALRSSVSGDVYRICAMLTRTFVG